MELVMYVIRAAIGLAIILVVLSLFGVSPYDVGREVGDVIDNVGTFFDGVQDS